MSTQVEQAIDQEIRSALALAATPPQQRKEKPLPRWTLKRLVLWVEEKFNLKVCRDTIRKTLKKRGFSWKKARKILNKANREKRAEFLVTLEGLLEDAWKKDHLLVYIDEAHIHLDCDEGYGWSIKGERFWVSSCSPGLEKVSFYGVYLYNLGQVRIFPFDTANQSNTIDVLKKLRLEFPNMTMTVIWDQAPYHRAGSVKSEASTLKINLEPLPSYSPDFMPVEHLEAMVKRRCDLSYLLSKQT